MDQDQVKEFADKNKVKIEELNRLSRCVDGRYEGMDLMPMIAKPGADAGDVLAVYGALNILGLEWGPEKALQLVVDSLGGAANFRFHTDTHVDAGAVGMGCGHIKQAKLDPESYGVKQEQIDFLFEQLPKLMDAGAKQEILQGDHAEQAVLVVDSENYGLKPLLRGEDLQEAFVYQKTWHAKQLAELANKLQETIAENGLVRENSEIQVALNDAFGKQLTETLKRLANGLPVYTVQIDDAGEVNVNQ